MVNAEDVLVKELTEEAERAFSTCDAYDMKANVLLVVVAFLAAQTAYFFSLAGSPLMRCGQILSGSLLAVGGLVILAELVPRAYSAYHPSNGAVENRIAKLRTEHGGDEGAVLLALKKAQIGWAKDRAAANNALNRKKSRLLDAAFYLVSGAVIVNLATLLLVVSHLFSLAR